MEIFRKLQIGKRDKETEVSEKCPIRRRRSVVDCSVVYELEDEEEEEEEEKENDDEEEEEEEEMMKKKRLNKKKKKNKKGKE